MCVKTHVCVYEGTEHVIHIGFRSTGSVRAVTNKDLWLTKSIGSVLNRYVKCFWLTHFIGSTWTSRRFSPNRISSVSTNLSNSYNWITRIRTHIHACVSNIYTYVCAYPLEYTIWVICFPRNESKYRSLIFTTWLEIITCIYSITDQLFLHTCVYYL